MLRRGFNCYYDIYIHIDGCDILYLDILWVVYIYCELLNAYLFWKENLWNGGEIYEFMEMWLKCGTCGFIGRWRFRPGYDMRCGLLGDGDSALIVISCDLC